MSVHTLRLFLIFPLLLAALLTGCASSTRSSDVTSRATADSTLSVLARWMHGSFSSAEQAKVDPEFREIVLHMTPIWTEDSGRTGDRWLYVEQAAAGSLDKPYRQRIYRLRAYQSGAHAPCVFVSDVYTLPGDPLAFAGAWQDPAKLAGLQPGQLTFKDGCSLVLREPRLGDTAAERCFIGSTLGRGCPSDLRGAAYATSEARIFADRLETWDQGFDASGKQVWGAVKGPYVFRRTTSQ